MEREEKGSRRYELGFLTTEQVVDEYGLSVPTLAYLRKHDLLHVRAPTGLTRPVLYVREELDKVLLGVGP